jgi:hypothetical protein
MTDSRISALKAALATADNELEQAVRTLAPKHVGGEMAAYEAAYQNLLTAERNLAQAENRPYAVPIDCALSWDVGAPLPTLLQSDETTILFFLLPYDDENVGRIQFDGVLSTMFGAPNDETFEGHPLHGSGFEPSRAMRVVNSLWIAQLEKMNSVHQYHDSSRYAVVEHFVFPFHDTTFECAARSFKASKVGQRLSEAVRGAVSLLY